MRETTKAPLTVVVRAGLTGSALAHAHPRRAEPATDSIFGFTIRR